MNWVWLKIGNLGLGRFYCYFPFSKAFEPQPFCVIFLLVLSRE